MEEITVGMFMSGVITVFCAVILWFVIRRDRAEARVRQEESEALEKKAKILLKAKEIGPLFRINNVNNVVAVCAEDDSSSAHETYCREVEEGKRKRSERIVLKVIPTFTFWKKRSAQTLMHTGESRIAEEFVTSFLCRILGITEKEMGSDGDKIFRTLIVEDGRLFVPFAGGASEEQEQLYGRTSMKDFEEFFKSKVMEKVSKI